MKIRSHKLSVTRDVILESLPRNQTHCMVANAIREQVRGAYSVHVTSEYVRFNVGDAKEVTGIRYVYPMPGRVTKKIEEFDAAYEKDELEKIGPFVFSLDGRQATYASVVKVGERPHTKKRKPHKKKAKVIRRCTVRRYKGLSQVGV